MSTNRPRAGGKARLFTVDEDGNYQLAPHVVPLLALIVVAFVLLLSISYCTAGLVDGGDEREQTVPLATPQFTVAPVVDCDEADQAIVDAITDDMIDPRLSAGRTVTYGREDGALTVGAMLRRDDGAIEAVAAIFAVDTTGKLYAISAQARELTRLPDGRQEVAMTPVDPGAQAVNSCLRD